MFDKSLDFLSADQNLRIVFNTLEGNYALCLLANLVQLAYLEREHAQSSTYYPTFVVSFFFIARVLSSDDSVADWKFYINLSYIFELIFY